MNTPCTRCRSKVTPTTVRKGHRRCLNTRACRRRVTRLHRDRSRLGYRT